MIPLENVVVLSALLFTLGAVGVAVRRDPVVVLLSLQLMFAAANLLLVGFARASGAVAAHAFALVVLAVGAAQLAVGLAIAVAAFHDRRAVDLEAARDPDW